jgi:hypothetical protein
MWQIPPPGPIPGGPLQTLTLTSQSVIDANTTRQYFVHLPPHFSSTNNIPAPLILAFHGQTQPTWSMERITQLSTEDFNTDYVVVYPEGLDFKEPGVRLFLSFFFFVSTRYGIPTQRLTNYSNNGSVTPKHRLLP